MVQKWHGFSVWEFESDFHQLFKMSWPLTCRIPNISDSSQDVGDYFRWAAHARQEGVLTVAVLPRFGMRFIL